MNLMEGNLRNPHFKRVRRVSSSNMLTEVVEDRISSLPDGICSYIISFLSHKDAVATSILSKKWRYIWAFTPNLDFDYSLFPGMKRKKETFVDFVEQALVCRDGSAINRFRLCLSLAFGESDVHRISTWISSVLRCKVQELDLDIPGRGVHQLPSSLFASGYLAVLKLKSSSFTPRLPSTMGFSQLKKLHLENVGFSNSKVTPANFSFCPVLEDLNMERCYLDDFEVLNISSQTLKSLTIDDCVCLHTCNIKISTPNLMRFKYTSSVVNEFCLENVSSLVEAIINLRELNYSRKENYEEFDFDISEEFRRKEGYGHRLSRILRGLSCVEVMKFAFLGMKFLSPWEDSLHLPTFFILRDLKLTTGPKKIDIELISCLLKNSPNLESLTINAFESISPALNYFTSLPTFYDLKYLKMNIGLTTDHIQLLAFLTESTPNLETLIIDILEPYKSWGEDSKSDKLILEFPVDHVKTVEIRYFGVSPKNVEVRHLGQSLQNSLDEEFDSGAP